MASKDEHTNLLELEFNRQVENLVEKGYPKAAGVSEDKFLSYLTPLNEKLTEVPQTEDRHLAFAIVVTQEILLPQKAVSLVAVNGKSGFTVLAPDELSRFTPIKGITIPNGKTYLITGIDTGEKTTTSPLTTRSLIYEAKTVRH